ncbi:ribbon-helix-helix domain-containing protein [Dactylosporangium sp. CA-092794]|uniref:ribbon-helix-helix domain-containing protein n=1 Tax=Dactylosporangium sp. CA-092794 TaxID=3239929 RepID=UPI003D8CF9CA
MTLPDELLADLKQVAEAEHRSVDATIVAAIAQYVQAHDKWVAVQAIAAEVSARHGDLLDRLGGGWRQRRPGGRMSP